MLNVAGVTPRPDIALAIQQEETLVDQYVAHKVFPIMEVAVSTAPIPSFLRRREIYRVTKAKGGGYARTKPVAGTAATFNCVDSGLEEPLDAKDIELLGGEGPAVEVTATGLTEDVLRARDAALATLLFTTGTFGSGYNAAAAAVWGHATASNPVADVSDAIEKVRLGCGNAANVLLISGGLYAKARKDPKISAAYRAIMGYTNAQAGIDLNINLKGLAALFGVEEVLVGGGVKDTADEGQTRSKASVWADTFALAFYRPPTTRRTAPFLGRTFVYNDGLTADMGTAGSVDALRGLNVEEYDSPATNERVVRVRQFIDMPLLNKDSGFLITGC